MVYQALGTREIVPPLDWERIVTFLIFLTFRVPCLSPFARALGRKEAFFFVGLSVGIALVAAGAIRVALTAIGAFWYEKTKMPLSGHFCASLRIGYSAGYVWYNLPTANA